MLRDNGEIVPVHLELPDEFYGIFRNLKGYSVTKYQNFMDSSYILGLTEYEFLLETQRQREKELKQNKRRR